MPKSTTTLGDVLTLSEAASLLRVEVAPLAELAEEGAVPVRKIGEEWRFSRTALMQWLHSGPDRFSCTYEASLLEKLVVLLAQRTSDREGKTPRPGSKEAVMRCFGVFAGEDDMEEELARLAAIRRGDAAEAQKGIPGQKRQAKG